MPRRRNGIRAEAPGALDDGSAGAHVPPAVRFCRACRESGSRDASARFMHAIVSADVAGGMPGFPMDLCRLHLADVRDHFGAVDVVIVERYTRCMSAAPDRAWPERILR